MSLVDEHYSRVFRLLAADVLCVAGAQQAAESTAPSSSLHKKLVERAFSLSAQLLDNSRASTPEGQPGLAAATADDNEDDDDGSAGRYDSMAAPEHRTAADLLLASAVAATHARTVQQLLDVVLPLAADVDFWNMQDSGLFPLALYFAQTLPQRLFGWARYAAVFVRDSNACPVSPQQIRHLLSTRHLFPETGQQGPKLGASGKGRRGVLELLRVPDGVNVLGLTRYEIRHKRQCLRAMQRKLAVCIGTLSQAAPGPSYDMHSSSTTTTTAGMLLQQVCDVLRAVASADSRDVDLDLPLITSASAVPAEAVKAVVDQVALIPKTVGRRVQAHRRPSLIARSWLPAAAALVGTRWLSGYIAGHRDDLREWLTDSILTLRNYTLQYILAPLRSAYETIRYGKHTYSVMSEESLSSDLRSLEDMVVSFARRMGPVDPAAVRLRVEQGDLSDVMKVYSRDLQRPFQSALFGDLVQAMLIQVQKVKVDVGQTMAALDKLLKSNELNFLLLSTVPATLSIYAAVSWLASRVSWWASGGSRHTMASIATVVRDIDRLLNTSSPPASEAPSRLPAAAQGRLICLAHYLRHHAHSLPNAPSVGRLQTGAGWVCTLPRMRTMFLQDIRDIECADLTTAQKQRVVSRMSRTFHFL
ncbi:Nuclear control of ATPase protein 2 [Coemansia sp. RSA 552]|nr:Nuclear control of ATPase protein 2 [Coemansia sp. RSA 552]